jgi:hypothetical protein
LAEAEVARRFGLQLRKKFLFQPPLEPATVAPCQEVWVATPEEILVPASAGTGDGGTVGVTDLVGGVVVELCSLPSVVCSGGKPRILGIG